MKGNEMEYVIPLGKVFSQPRTKRARKAVVAIRRFVSKHARASGGQVAITRDVNHAVWENSYNIPRRLNVMLQKHDGRVYVYLQGSRQIEEDKKLRELQKKKVKEKKGEKKKTEEERAAEEEAGEKKKEKRAKELAAEKSAIKRKTRAEQG